MRGRTIRAKVRSVFRACSGRHVEPRNAKPGVEELERIIALAATWVGGGDGASWTDPQNWSIGRVPGASDDVLLDVPGDLMVVYRGSSPSVKSIENHETIWVQGSAGSGAAILRTIDKITNYNTIRLETSSNTDFDQGSYLNVGGTLINESSGVVEARVGAGDGRSITGHVVNRGLVAGTGIDLSIVDVYTADGGVLEGGAFLWPPPPRRRRRSACGATTTSWPRTTFPG